MQRNRLAPSAHGMWLMLALAALAGFGLAVVVALVGAASATAAERPALDGRSLSPAAGWHGRAVSAPAPIRVDAGGTPAGWAAGTVRRGDGRGLRNGSDRVREVQRTLRTLGYHPGRVTGVFTRRTQEAVGWFEYKHQLPVDGVVTVGTLHALRTAQDLTLPERRAQRRARAQRAGADRPAAAGAQDAPQRAATAPEPAAETVTDRISDVAWWVWAAIAAAVLAVIALVAWLLRRRHTDTDEGPVYELWVNGSSPDPAIGTFRGVVKAVSVPEDPKPAGWVADSQYLVSDPTKPQPFWAPAQHIDQLGAAAQRTTAEDVQTPAALGYVAGPATSRRSPAATTIHAACRQRGWELGHVIHDPSPARPGLRPGLGQALKRIADGEADRLVIARLAHVGPAVEDLARLIGRLDEHDATLVVCDIDLDTATTGGRRTANALTTLNPIQPVPKTRTAPPTRTPAHH
jgi:peptidoglycan hydrolase-like protein with peptidoglycan-binding domain